MGDDEFGFCSAATVKETRWGYLALIVVVGAVGVAPYSTTAYLANEMVTKWGSGSTSPVSQLGIDLHCAGNAIVRCDRITL